MNKKFFGIIAAVGLLAINAAAPIAQPMSGMFSKSAITANATTRIGDYEIDEGTGTILNICKNLTQDDEVEIPSVIGGITIKSIGKEAFYGCRAKKITIPDTVTTIQKKAFGFSEAQNIILSNSTVTIEDSAFRGCEHLESIDIPNTVKTIADNAFNTCTKLKSVRISDSVESIGTFAFNNCSSLENVTISENSNLSSIGDYAFFDCQLLKSIYLPKTLTTIGEFAFERCKSLEKITIPENSQLTSIGRYAFQECSALKELLIPESIKSLGDCVICNCPKLKTIYYPGTREQWYAIDIKEPNDELSVIDIIFGKENGIYPTSVALSLNGTLDVLIKFNKDFTANDGITINGKKAASSDKITVYSVAAKDFINNIVIAENGKELRKINVSAIISKYAMIAETKEIASKIYRYCDDAKAYFNGEKTINYSSSEYNTVSKEIGSHTPDMGSNYYGSSLLLKSGTILRHYYTSQVAGSIKKDNLYYIDEVVPAHKYSNADKYCVNDYIYKVLTNPEADSNLKNLCVSLYYYGVGAENYAKANGGIH